MPATPEDLFAFLREQGIDVRTFEHPPLFTVEESRSHRGDIPGEHSKNLFLKDRDGRLFLLVAQEDARIDLKRLPEKIGARGRVSFGAAELLEEAWGVRPGAVTPFGAINDPDGRVTVVLDATLLQEHLLNFHPLVNTRTTSITSDGLLRFLRATGHEPLVVDART